MDVVTAEQAAEAAKGLTFEKVWAAMMESGVRMEEMNKETKKQIQETQKQMKEAQTEIRESQRQMRETVDDLSKNVGGLGNSLGRLTETLFSVNLWEKFNDLGYPFTKQGPHVKFCEGKKVLAEVDYMLENGEYAMPVEVKTDLTTEDIKEHLQRIEVIRRYFDERGDKRKLVGAVAGGIVNDNVLKYARKQGLYVILKSGDSVTIADNPPDFKLREWKFDSTNGTL